MDNRFYKSNVAQPQAAAARVPTPMHHQRNKASAARFALSPVAVVAASLLQPLPALAQADGEPSPRLTPAPQLSEDIPAAARSQLPTFVEGDRIQGQTDVETSVEGNAVLRRGDTVIRADRLEYKVPDDLARARGNVRINKAGNIFEGPLLELKVDAFEGFFIEPRYQFLRNGAYGEAERVDFIDDQRAVIHKATYTTCKRHGGPSWMPDWILRASKISLDQAEETGHAEGAVLDFLGFPILPVPSISFPLGEKRKSGLLPPTFGLDNRNGAEFTLPYYWNIAPNRDATLYPTLMSRRGVDLGGEFRYLEPSYSGLVRGNYLPNDRLRDRDRWGFHAEHVQNGLVLPWLGRSNLALDLNRVSDDNYWKDFSRDSSSFTQRLLANNGSLTFGIGDVTVTGRMLTFQTLQDPAAPIVPPYDRAPQLTATQSRTDLWGGLETYLEADFTRFRSASAFGILGVPSGSVFDQPNADRTYLLAQVSRPWRAPGWFFIPKMQAHVRSYSFDGPIANGATSASRAVPTFSLDSGLVFERDASFFGRAFRQTLEPRAFYVYTPFVDQNYLPNYDSGLNDFSFATIYTENAFGGNDRIADNNLLTVGATTRLIDPDTGAEAARFGLAQRIRFSDQNVTLPVDRGTTLPASNPPAVSERLSDVLFGSSIALVPNWGFDTTVQFNPKTSQSIRTVIGAHYSPGPFRVVSAGYRRQQGISEQLDLGWQWPLGQIFGASEPGDGPVTGAVEGRWFSVGRLNYSLRDKRFVDAVVGLEYDAGCWIGRVVFERLQAGTELANKRVLFQLEFLGFSRLGSNALQSLKQNIPRYQYLRERTEVPSRFSNYD
ncbi:MAG: organic solvent tolerance protein precursor-like protein [Ramlibacter sp.]|jgi:LPS-assembly protein|nr:organic solvent tolerance protein precursor-like protein [Ramlibacter sp.]